MDHFRRVKRHNHNRILQDLVKKMVFVLGPRQSGKTWLCKQIGAEIKPSTYLNYDSFTDREIIVGQKWHPETALLILDELHKMPDWKNFLKGIFDTKPARMQILVTGSARLEAFRHAGDSLAGRYFSHRLLPFSPAEVKGQTEADLVRFLERGGFPEPFLADSDTDADRWRREYINDLIRIDVLDFEKIHDFKAIQTVFELLRRRVGSPVSYASLAEDVGISPNTVKKYISVFEDLYIVFRVTPYSNNIARSLLKEPKIYFFDNGLVIGDEGARFENLVAASLLKHVYNQNDALGRDAELHYIRTKDGEEVDFCLTENQNPTLMIEAKFSDASPAKSLVKMHHKTKIRAMQLVRHLRNETIQGTIEIRRGDDFLSALSA